MFFQEVRKKKAHSNLKLAVKKVIILYFLFIQILISMGVDDLMAAKNMVMRAIQTTELNRIDYQTFNSLQRVENNQVEARYNALLQRVGTTVSFDADLVSQLLFLNVTSQVSRDIECLNRDWVVCQHISSLPKLYKKIYSRLSRCCSARGSSV